MRVMPGNVPASLYSPSGTVVNSGPGTVFYGDDGTVTTTSFDGSLAPGATVAITGTMYFVGGPADVDVRGPIASSGGGGGGGAATGTGPPASLATGATYFELNSNGQTVAVWLGVSGVATRVMNVDPPAIGAIDPAALGEIYPRADAGSTVTTSTRQLLSSGPITLYGGVPITNLKIHTGSTAAVAPVHHFVAFYDFRTGALLAAGADQLTNAVPTNLPADYPISYTPTTTRVARPVYYIEATTVPNLQGKGSVQAGAVDPRHGGLHDTLTAGSVPANLPATIGAVGSGKGPFWCEWK